VGGLGRNKNWRVWSEAPFWLEAKRQVGPNQIANVLLRIILYSAVNVRCSTLGLWCPTTLNLPYSEREIKIERFGGRPPSGGRPGALGPMPPAKSGPEWMKAVRTEHEVLTVLVAYIACQVVPTAILLAKLGCTRDVCRRILSERPIIRDALTHTTASNTELTWTPPHIFSVFLCGNRGNTVKPRIEAGSRINAGSRIQAGDCHCLAYYLSVKSFKHERMTSFIW